jgi:hypothetical protein
MKTKGKCASRRLRPRYQFMNELMQKEGRSWEKTDEEQLWEDRNGRRSSVVRPSTEKKKTEWRYGRN